jgi:predicted CXXCH cytochrome family protein
MFDRSNGVCTTCHAVQHDPARGVTSPAWQVAPIVTTSHWLPQSTFSHADHTNAACTSCHGAATSRNAADILIPDIASCRTCHAGAQKDAQKVVSQCDSCHGFHPKKDHPVFEWVAAGRVVPGRPTAAAAHKERRP